jgi:hypothetical protein
MGNSLSVEKLFWFRIFDPFPDPSADEQNAQIEKMVK